MTKEEFRRLAQSGLLFLDGATGSNLQKQGMPVGVCPELWITEHEEIMSGLQKAYLEAGTNILYAPTFTANRIKLKEFDLEDRIEELNHKLVEISKRAADGKALVAGDLTMTGQQLKPMGPLDFEELGENVYINILNQAKDYVYIATPYLLISDEMENALCTAAKRGVDVRILMPGIPDKPMVFYMAKSYYPPLLRAGVKIYEYSPGFVHSKSYVCDDRIATVGTINMDFRSLYLHFECGTLLYGCKAVMDVKKDMEECFPKCHEVTMGDCRQGVIGDLLTSVLRVLAPLM